MGQDHRVWRARRTAQAVLGALVAVALLAPSARAGSGPTLGRYASAHVNGSMGAHEYSSCTGPTTEHSGSRTYHVTICAQNDAHNLYFALKIDDPLSTGFDAPAFWFDNNDDGHLAAAGPGGVCAPPPAPVDDGFNWSFVSSGIYDDWNTCFGPNFAFTSDMTPNGTGGCTPAATSQTCEFSKPLHDGDPDDFQLHAGSRAGWCFTWQDRGNPADAIGNFAGDISVPTGCWLDSSQHRDALHGNSSRWANVAIYSQLQAILAEVRSEIARYVAVCRCPPDPTKTLTGEVHQLEHYLAGNSRSRATRATRALIASTQRYARSGALGKTFAATLVKRALHVVAALEHPSR
jgi:hypothetical protein